MNDQKCKPGAIDKCMVRISGEDIVPPDYDQNCCSLVDGTSAVQ